MGCVASSRVPPADVPRGAPPRDPAGELDAAAAAAGPRFVTRPDQRRPIVLAKTGIASTKPVTLLELFEKARVRHGASLALAAEANLPAYKPGDAPAPATPRETWKRWTYDDYYNDARAFARATLRAGATRYQGVVIFGFNSPEWLIAQIGAMMAGCIPAGIYSTDEAPAVAYKTRHSDSVVGVVEDESKLRRFEEKIDDMPKLRALVVWSPHWTGSVKSFKRADGTEVAVWSWRDFIAAQPDDGDLDKRVGEIVKSIQPEDCACIVYTSGTTGNPKAVMLSHDNLVFESVATFHVFPRIGSGGQERVLSYLPLSHVAASLVDFLNPICTTALKVGYCTTYFARPYDLKIGTFGERLRAVQPTLFMGVPRVFEKIEERMRAAGAKNKGLKKRIAAWAKAKGLERQRQLQLGGTGKAPRGFDFAKKVVFSKAQKALGLDECKVIITGAAPISPATLEYFGSLDLYVNEAWGMSELSGAATTTDDTTRCWGSIGSAHAGCEVKVFREITDKGRVEAKPAKDLFRPTEEEQGELCARGRVVMLGYMHNPDMGDEEEVLRKNRETIDEEGWVRTGDKATMGENGVFRITGRFKELIIGAGGENVPPVGIEDRFRELAPAISKIIMIGDKRKFNTALVTLQTEGATGELKGNGKLVGPSAAVSPKSTTAEQAAKDPVWHKYLLDALDKLNADSSVIISDAYKIQKLTILPWDFSVEGGEYTATLKFRRAFIDDKYRKAIDVMYESDKRVVEFAGV